MTDIRLVWKRRGQSLVGKACKCAVLSDPRSSFAVLGQHGLVLIVFLKSWRTNKLLVQERGRAMYGQLSCPHEGQQHCNSGPRKGKGRGRKSSLGPRKDGCSEDLGSTLSKSNLDMLPVGLMYRGCSAWYAARFHWLDYHCTTRMIKKFSTWFLNREGSDTALATLKYFTWYCKFILFFKKIMKGTLFSQSLWHPVLFYFHILPFKLV